VRMLAAPFEKDGEPGGAVVAFADETQLLSTESRLRLWVLLGCLGLLALSSAAGYVLAGRSLGSAAVAFQQQEQFLADAAHEIRTPIAAIRALAEGAAAGDQSADEAIGRMSEIATHASSTVDDLLFLARADAGKDEMRREPLRLDLLVEQVAEGVVGVELDLDPVVVDGDHSLLRRAIGNLVDNVVRHGRALDPGVPIRIAVDAGRVVVEDAGPGVSRAWRTRRSSGSARAAGAAGRGWGFRSSARLRAPTAVMSPSRPGRAAAPAPRSSSQALARSAPENEPSRLTPSDSLRSRLAEARPGASP